MPVGNWHLQRQRNWHLHKRTEGPGEQDFSDSPCGYAASCIKKNNREVGPALVGIELADRVDLEPLLGRIAASGLDVQRLPPGTPIFHLLV